MILRTLKIFVIASALWFALPCFTVEMPDGILMEWQGGLKRWAVLRAVCLYLETLFLVSLLDNIWHFGERQDGVKRVYSLQSKRLLLYSGVPLTFLALMSEIDFSWRGYGRQAMLKICVVTALYFTRKTDNKSVYGLQHGRLHLDAYVPMWMNMGYWKAAEEDVSKSKSLAEACRDLLKLVLAEAGISKEETIDRSRCLIDVGFGCGEQTIYLMSEKPSRPSDKLWWDHKYHKVYFEQYVGITQDKAQCQYAQERVDQLEKNNVNLFCADASNPQSWGEQLLSAIKTADAKSQETWLLALDTAYHFSPSRWVLIRHAHQNLNASFMAFDLCLSPTATPLQRLMLRVLTAFMDAPWANFDTPEAYRQKLQDIGYPVAETKIVDISEHVFAHLANHLESQNRRLKMLGLSIGSFHAAKWLFKWWSETGLVRGVVVVAKHSDPTAYR